MRRRLQFSLRALLVALTAFSIWFGWLAESARRQRAAIKSLASIPNSHFYEGEVTIDESGLIASRKDAPVSGIRKWVAERVGMEYVADITGLALTLGQGAPSGQGMPDLALPLSQDLSRSRGAPDSQGMPDFEVLSNLPLEYLSLEGGPLDRVALAHLKRMKTLRWLVLYGDVGLDDRDLSELRQALPACRVAKLAQPWGVLIPT